jgi:hypothetical protein
VAFGLSDRWSDISKLLISRLIDAGRMIAIHTWEADGKIGSRIEASTVCFAGRPTYCAD